MGQPTEEDNLSGYEASSVLPRVGNFTDCELLLIHGTADGMCPVCGYVNVCVSVCVYVNVCMSVCVYVNVCMSVCLCVCVC